MRARPLVVAFLLPSTALAQSPPTTPLVVTTDWLADHLGDPRIVVVEVAGRDTDAAADHIPGARRLKYMSLVRDADGISSELPAADSIRSLLENLGASDDSHIVLAGPPLAVTRAFFTFDYFGFPRVSALDGGLSKWKSEGRRTQPDLVKPSRGRISPRAARTWAVASTEWVRDHIGKHGISLFDTRTDSEYLGIKWADGHIGGARRIDWHDFLPDQKEFKLADRATLTRLWSERTESPTDTIVAYCQVGYRASGTYFVSRLLGVPVKLYDGSYDAWSKANLPLTRTPTPLATRAAPKRTGGGLPSVSPDGKFVAYNALRDSKQSDTYVIRVDGTHETRIAETPEWEAAPQWLDGRVVTGGVINDTTHLYAASPETPSRTPLFTAPGREVHVSPDGRRLLYVSGAWPTTRLFISNSDGSNARPLTDESHAAFNPAWSPDGRRVAYTISDPTTHAIQVAVIDVDGGNQHQLTHFAAEEGSPQWPAWSPDGKRLAIQAGKYSRERPATNTSHLWIINLADGALRKLNPHDRPYLDETPSWFPDGKRIAFQSDRTGVMQIWVMNDDGTGARQLTSWNPTP